MGKNGPDNEKRAECVKDDLLTTPSEAGPRTKARGNATKLYWTASGMMSLLKAPKQVQVLCRILAKFCAMCSWHGNMLSVGKTVGQLAMAWISKKQTTQQYNSQAHLRTVQCRSTWKHYAVFVERLSSAIHQILVWCVWCWWFSYIRCGSYVKSFQKLMIW